MIVRKTVMHKTYAPTLEMSDIKGSIDDITQLFIEEQIRVAAMYGIEDISTIMFEAEGYGYDGGVQMMVRYPRLETDAELEARVKKEVADEKRAAKKEEKERAEYERLKAKFGE